MALEDITSRILERAREQADKTLAKARKEADELKRETSTRVERASTSAYGKATEEAKAAAARIVASAESEANKAILSAKQDSITAAIDRAVEELRQRDEAGYLDLLAGLLAEIPFDTEAEMIVSQADRRFLETNLESLQKRLSGSGKKLRLSLSDETRDIGGGILLKMGKIEFNASLPAVRRAKEEELRAVAARILFPGADAA